MLMPPTSKGLSCQLQAYEPVTGCASTQVLLTVHDLTCSPKRRLCNGNVKYRTASGCAVGIDLFDLEQAGNETCRDSSATFTDVEALTGFKSQRVVNLAHHLDVVTGLNHLVLGVLYAFGPKQVAGFI